MNPVRIEWLANRRGRVDINEDGMTIFIFNPDVGPWVDVPENVQRRLFEALKEKFENKEPEASKGHWVTYVGKDWEGTEPLPFNQEKEPTDICELCGIPLNENGEIEELGK